MNMFNPSHLRTELSKVPSWLMLASLALWLLARNASGVTPSPDGCYPNYTTAEGCNALQSLTTGAGNTGVGWRSLFFNTTASFNTAVGAGALVLNNGDSNTAVGAGALLTNTAGNQNTANGASALFYNSGGSNNTAVGYGALLSNTTGNGNCAFGTGALFFQIGGGENSAFGGGALYVASGTANSALGSVALTNLGDGFYNTAVGQHAGFNLTTGSGNVYIGQGVEGQSSEDDHTYIRNINTTTVSGGNADVVSVDLSTGLLGHASSSRRYKKEIKAMKNASETLYRLKPVTYRYKNEIDPSQALDYGLVAEEVADVDPNLTVCNREGEIESVRYSAINAMLLNEFLKEHQKVEEQNRKIEEQKMAIADLKKEMENVVFRLKEQDLKLQKVDAQMESLSSPQLVSVP